MEENIDIAATRDRHKRERKKERENPMQDEGSVNIAKEQLNGDNCSSYGQHTLLC